MRNSEDEMSNSNEGAKRFANLAVLSASIAIITLMSHKYKEA